MPQRLACLTLCFVTLPGLQPLASAAEVPYDEVVADGNQALLNGSFEIVDRDGKLPARWGIPEVVVANVALRTGIESSRHGTRYLSVAFKQLRYLYPQLQRVPVGKWRVSVWARGQGQLSFALGLVRPNWRNLAADRKFLARQSSPRYQVAVQQWRQFVWECDVPAAVEVDGKPVKPESAQLTLGLLGNLSIDECLVAPVTAVAAAADATPEDRDADAGGGLRPPRVTIPRLGQAPALDGTFAPDEWQRAAAVTGFTELNTRRLSRRQTVVFLGTTEDTLFVAFRCPHEGRLEQLPEERDRLGNMRNEAVELWLQPPGQPWRQFMVSSGGGLLDADETDHLNWNGQWRAAQGLTDIPEEIGGILSFRKKLWVVELAIPFASLGGKPPADGEQWKLNFTRDFGVPAGQKRAAADWTTWAPMQGRFRNPEQFGTAVFKPAAPAVQLLSLGDLPNGQVTVRGSRQGGGGPVRLSLRARPRDQDKTVLYASTEVEASGKPQPFTLGDTLQVNRETPLFAEIEAVAVDSGERLASCVLPFTATAALRVKAVPVFSRHVLYVHADATQVGDLPSPLQVTAELRRGATSLGRQASTVWRDGTREGELSLSLADLPPGDYEVSVHGQAGDESLLAAVAEFTLPPSPKWAGNRLGLEAALPPPWTPVRARGNVVAVTQRQYAMGPLGLPDQVSALGEALLSGPARLVVVVDGHELTWQAGPLAPPDSVTDGVRWPIQATAGTLILDGSVTVEFDGFALWDIELSTEEATEVEALRLEFPFRANRALYARGRDATLSDRGTFAALLRGGDPTDKDDTLIAGGHFCSGGWIWPEQWCHELWVGDDERGLSVMCETREPLRGPRRTEIVTEAEATTLKLHLIDGATRVDHRLRYRYAWQATPVKPRPTDPKRWHACYRRRQTDDAMRAPGVPNRLGVTTDMWALKYESYPQLFRSPAAFKDYNGWLQAGGTKIVPYSGTNLVTLEVPELAPYRSAWEAYPSVLGANPRGQWYVSCPNAPLLRDFKVDCLRQLVDELGFNGLYLDVSSCAGCSNHYHGCGYRSPDTGAWQQTVPLFAARELYKRLYRVNKAQGRDAWLFRHGMPVAATAGFVDVVTQGEDWCREANDQYDRLTPEIFRTREARVQYGTPYTWYTFHHYYRGEKFGGRVPLSAILAYCLPHRVLPTDGRPGMWPVWDALDPFWPTAEFHPYWVDPPAATTGDRDVVASVYLLREARKALLVVANWAREDRRVTVTVDLAELGFDPVKTKVARALAHPIRQPEDAPESDPMPNAPLGSDPSKLSLALSSRNLEVLRLSQPE